MKQLKIALAMIVKGTDEEPKKLRRALSTVAPYVDGIFITLTGPRSEMGEAESVCREFKATISYNRALWKADKKAVAWLAEFFGYEPYMKVGDELFLFDVARNYNFGQVPKEYDYILWMDADDILRGGDKLHELADIGDQAGIEAFYFNYIYQAEFDEKGNITSILIEHLRERLVRNSGVYKWIAPIHETLIEQSPTRKTDVYDCDIVHLSTQEDRIASLNRNLKNLEYAIYLSEGKDPRHIYYLAKALYDIRTAETDDRSLKLIYSYLLGENPSGWPEERAQAWEYLAELYRRRGEHNNSLKTLMNALIEEPENPSIFLNIAASHMLKNEWERALFWVRIASTIPEKKTTLVRNPRDVQARTLEIIYNCSINLSKVDEAWAAAKKITDLFPEDKMYKEIFTFVSHLRQQRDLTKMVTEYASYLEKSGEAHKIKPLLQSLPAAIEDNPFMVELYQKNNPPKYWDEKEVAIFCGPGFTNWSPKRLEQPGESFVGGSEEAVIKMSEALQKQGWEVSVYADPGTDEGVHDGVKWLPYYKFNKRDHFNILIAWRNIRFFDQDIKAKKKYLWAHDILNPIEFTPERVDQLEKIIVLSNWHRQNVPTVPDDKFFLSSNGI